MKQMQKKRKKSCLRSIYDAEEEDEEDSLRLRRSVRTRKPPSRYGDYVFLTYEQAITGLDKENWKKAIQEEKKSLKKNKTWKLVERSEADGTKILSSPDGSLK